MHKNKNILLSFKYAILGIIAGLKSERNMKVDLVVGILTLILGFILKISRVELIIIIILIGMVISCELINTAIETIVDLVSPEINILAKKAKDLGAGAVLVSAIAALLGGAIIFLPKLILLVSSFLTKII